MAIPWLVRGVTSVVYQHGRRPLVDVDLLHAALADGQGLEKAQRACAFLDCYRLSRFPDVVCGFLERWQCVNFVVEQCRSGEDKLSPHARYGCMAWRLYDPRRL